MRQGKSVTCPKQLRAELIAAREKAGKSQREVSKALGLPPNGCYFVEKGERRLEVCEFIDYLNFVDADASEIVARLQGKRK